MDAIAVIAGIVGLVWAGVLFLRGGLLGGCLAVMLSATCFSVPFFKVPLGPVPLTIDRVLLVVVCIQYIFWRRWGWADPKPIAKPEILLLFFIASMIISTFSADWTVGNYQPLSGLILHYLMPATVYWIVRQTRITERAITAMLGYFAVLGAYLALTSVAEYYEAWSLVFPKYIVTTAVEQTAEFVGRGRGPLLNPIGNGMMLTIALSAMLLLWPRLRLPGRSCIIAAASLSAVAIALSLTRSVWMGGVFAVMVIVGTAIPRHWRLPLLGGAVLVGVCLAVAQWENLVAFKRDKNLSAEETAESVELRPVLAVVAWHMFLDHPLLGCGYFQYQVEHLNYVSDRSTDLPLERARGYSPHNVAFSLLTETGLVGLGLFVSVLFFWSRDAWRLWRNGGAPTWARRQGLLFLVAVAVYLINGMFHDVSMIAMANMTLFFLAGMTAGLRPLATPCQSPASTLC